jgi:hypothetical protein
MLLGCLVIIPLAALPNDIAIDTRSATQLTRLAGTEAIAADFTLAAFLARLRDSPPRCGRRASLSHIRRRVEQGEGTVPRWSVGRVWVMQRVW